MRQQFCHKRKASERGFQQVLWLSGKDGYITEAGMMNAFFVFQNNNSGKKELVTAPLDGTILEGVVRDSILKLARERLDSSEWDVNERYYTIKEVKERSEKGELVEAFGSGTAATVSPIKEISYRGDLINVPLQGSKECGEMTELVSNWILGIQYGEVDNSWSVVV